MEAFNLKISKVGGLSKARLMRDLAESLGLRLTIEDTWGGDHCNRRDSPPCGEHKP